MADKIIIILKMATFIVLTIVGFLSLLTNI